MANDRFVYVTYIRTTPEKLWEALTTPEFQQQYWFGMHIDSDFKVGSPWTLQFEDGRVADEGEARASFDIELAEGSVKLTVIHEIDRADSKLIQAVSGGWPGILSSLKSLLETNQALVRPALAAADVR